MGQLHRLGVVIVLALACQGKPMGTAMSLDASADATALVVPADASLVVAADAAEVPPVAPAACAPNPAGGVTPQAMKFVLRNTGAEAAILRGGCGFVGLQIASCPDHVALDIGPDCGRCRCDVCVQAGACGVCDCGRVDKVIPPGGVLTIAWDGRLPRLNMARERPCRGCWEMDLVPPGPQRVVIPVRTSSDGPPRLVTADLPLPDADGILEIALGP